MIKNSNDQIKYITIGVDAANLLQGGGRTHLVEFLNAAKPEQFGIGKIIVWGSKSTLSLIENKEWLEKINPAELEKNLIERTKWQHKKLSSEAKDNKCDILFVPGSSYTGTFRPIVTMSQNMLPFEWNELLRYGFNIITIKLILLRYRQTNTFKSANAVIFLTNYAKKKIEIQIGEVSNSKIIPHGLNKRFIIEPRLQKNIESYTKENPYRILYVSVVDQYKHQWNVVKAVSKIRLETGWNLILDLVGPSYKPSMRRLEKSIKKYDSKSEWVIYHGKIDYNLLHKIYSSANAGLFASTCENMPNILIETMAAGLPIVCSDRGPMKEILENDGIYFNPEKTDTIIAALLYLIKNVDDRINMSHRAYKKAQAYSWDYCANETLSYLSEVYTLFELNNKIKS